MQVMWILFRSRRIASQPVAIRQVLIAFRVALIGGKSKTFTIYKLLEELIGYVSMHSRAKANAFGGGRFAFGVRRRTAKAVPSSRRTSRPARMFGRRLRSSPTIRRAPELKAAGIHPANNKVTDDFPVVTHHLAVSDGQRDVQTSHQHQAPAATQAF